jgi:Tol biopolymer transport system component
MRKTTLTPLLVAALFGSATPAVADSGGTIAYQQTDADGLFQLWSVPGAGGVPTQLTSHAGAPDPDACGEGCFAEQPEWSADGSRIFFDSDWMPHVHVWSIAGDGSDQRQDTFGDGWDGFPGASPDGKTLAIDFTEDGDSGQGIVLVPIGDGARQRLTNGPKRGWDTHPAYSPDGTKIAFMRFTHTECPSSACRARGFGGSIWVMDADGSDQRRLTAPGQVWADPQWTPDGSKLLIQSYDEGGTRSGVSSDLYTIRPDGTDLEAITRTRKGEFSFTGDWSPDGSRITYVHFAPGDDHLQIQTMAADGSDPQTVADCDSESFCDEPIWGPATTASAPVARPVSARIARVGVRPHARRMARKVRRMVRRHFRVHAVRR